jgi:lysyl-tRNA synthetase class I
LRRPVSVISSRDDYDVLSKVPLNILKRVDIEKDLRFPITMMPRIGGAGSSDGRHRDADIETALPAVAIEPEFLSQTKRDRAALYAEGVRAALEKRPNSRRFVTNSVLTSIELRANGL